MSAKRPVPEGRPSGRKPGIALLATANGRGEAEVWESKLRAAGIPCIVRNTAATAYLQADLPFGGPFEVYVPGTALVRARDVLGDLGDRLAPEPTSEARMFAWVWLFGIAVSLAVGIGVMVGLR